MHAQQSPPPAEPARISKLSYASNWVGATEPENLLCGVYQLPGPRYLPTAIDTTLLAASEPLDPRVFVSQVTATWLGGKRAHFPITYPADIEFDLYVALDITCKSFRSNRQKTIRVLDWMADCGPGDAWKEAFLSFLGPFKLHYLERPDCSVDVLPFTLVFVQLEGKLKIF